MQEIPSFIGSCHPSRGSPSSVQPISEFSDHTLISWSISLTCWPHHQMPPQPNLTLLHQVTLLLRSAFKENQWKCDKVGIPQIMSIPHKFYFRSLPNTRQKKEDTRHLYKDRTRHPQDAQRSGQGPPLQICVFCAMLSLYCYAFMRSVRHNVLRVGYCRCMCHLVGLC